MISLKSSLKTKSLFSKPVNPWYYTTLLLLFGFCFIKITESFIGIKIPPQGSIIDKLHIWTTPINHFFHQYPSASNTILIMTSFWIDASILFLCIRALFGSTIRPFLELFLFALFRQSLQFLVSLPVPEGIIWNYPGFPSLMVNYSIQHDLYFSAHTGICFLVIIELMRTRKKQLVLAGLFFFVLTITMIISLRIHYTIDIFTGFIVALLIVYFSTPISLYVDHYLQKFALRPSSIDPNLGN